jgi:hypothetical protein
MKINTTGTFVNQGQQGDVYLRRVATVPKGAKEVKRQGAIVLAHGETTGHKHAIGGARVAHFREDGSGGAVFVRSDRGGDATVKHEEHAPITPVGDKSVFEFIPQSEYSPGAIQRVED